MEAKFSARRGVVRGVVSGLMLLSLGATAAAQSLKLRNIELCNGVGRTSFDAQIGGCTALIDAGGHTPRLLAVAYNNRGNAHTGKGEYDRAIRDLRR